MPRAWASAISAVEVGERAEQRVDVAVVGDVVAEVAHRRPEDRRQPDGVDAEPGEVVEPRRDARAGHRPRRRRRPGTSAGRPGRRRPGCHQGAAPAASVARAPTTPRPSRSPELRSASRAGRRRGGWAPRRWTASRRCRCRAARGGPSAARGPASAPAGASCRSRRRARRRGPRGRRAGARGGRGSPRRPRARGSTAPVRRDSIRFTRCWSADRRSPLRPMSDPRASRSAPSPTTFSRLVSPSRISTVTPSKPRWPMSVSRISLPAASASGVASAASSSARSMASEPRAVVTAATSAADSSELWAAARRRGAGAVVAARRRSSRRGGAVVAAVARAVVRGRVVRRLGADQRSPVAAGAAVRGRSSRRGPRSPYVAAAIVRRGPRSSVTVAVRDPRAAAAAGSGVASAASRLGAAPPSALRGAATIRAGSAPMPSTPRLPGVRISKSRSPRPTPNASQAALMASSTDLPVNSWYSLMQRRLPRRPLRVRLGRIVDWAERSRSTAFARSAALG